MYDNAYSIASVQGMKITGLCIIGIDILLLLTWFVGACVTLSKVGEHVCYAEIFKTHFLILIHFVLFAFLCVVIGDLLLEEVVKHQEYKEIIRQNPLKKDDITLYQEYHYDYKLPYRVYQPLGWAAISLLSFFGDVTLLVFSTKIYQHSTEPECHAIELSHIVYDSVALFISSLSIIWFIVFSIYTIANKPSHCNTATTTTTTKKMN
jgi:hypothetical protein